MKTSQKSFETSQFAKLQNKDPYSAKFLNNKTSDSRHKYQLSSEKKYLYVDKNESIKNDYTRKILYQNQCMLNQLKNLRIRCVALQNQNKQLADENILLRKKIKIYGKVGNTLIKCKNESNQKLMTVSNNQNHKISEDDSCIGPMLKMIIQNFDGNEINNEEGLIKLQKHISAPNPTFLECKFDKQFQQEILGLQSKEFQINTQLMLQKQRSETNSQTQITNFDNFFYPKIIVNQPLEQKDQLIVKLKQENSRLLIQMEQLIKNQAKTRLKLQKIEKILTTQQQI